METIITILKIFFIYIPFFGILLFLIYVIKKSRSKQPKHILEKEKKELILKARSKKNKIIKWKSEDIEKISNNLDYNFRKGFTRRFNGYIKTLDDEKLIAFRRLDRGAINLTSKIIAIGSNFEIYFNQNKNNVSIFYNDKYLGKLLNNKDILNAENRIIGKLNRNESINEYYFLELNNDRIAYLIKNSDRRTFLRNPFFDFHPQNGLEVEPWIDNQTSTSKLLKLYREVNEMEYKWALSLVIYETVYNGIDFTQ